MSTTLGRTGPNKRPHVIGMVGSAAAAVVCLIIGLGSFGGSSDGSTSPPPTSDTVSTTGEHPELERFMQEQSERDARQEQREADMDDARSSRSLAPTGSPWGDRESQGSPWGRTTY